MFSRKAQLSLGCHLHTPLPRQLPLGSHRVNNGFICHCPVSARLWMSLIFLSISPGRILCILWCPALKFPGSWVATVAAGTAVLSSLGNIPQTADPASGVGKKCPAVILPSPVPHLGISRATRRVFSPVSAWTCCSSL